MKRYEKAGIWGEAVLISTGFMVFSFFIQYPGPVKLLAFVVLIFSALRIANKCINLSDCKLLIGFKVRGRYMWLFTGAGLVAGIILAFVYRDYLETSLLPVKPGFFLIPAALIGSTEEMVFRGFLQGYTSKVSGWGSVLFGSLAHTGYKCCLFMSPATPDSTDVIILAVWTFIAGMLFGTLRHLSGSIIPPVAGHAVFDILVYGEYSQAPWWVW